MRKASSNWGRVWVAGRFAGFLGLTAGLLGRVTPFEIQTLLPASHPVRQQYERYLGKFDDGRYGYILVHSDKSGWSEKKTLAISRNPAPSLETEPAAGEVIAPHNAKY